MQLKLFLNAFKITVWKFSEILALLVRQIVSKKYIKARILFIKYKYEVYTACLK